jgi:hypothetical protein
MAYLIETRKYITGPCKGQVVHIETCIGNKPWPPIAREREQDVRDQFTLKDQYGNKYHLQAYRIQGTRSDRENIIRELRRRGRPSSAFEPPPATTDTDIDVDPSSEP